MLEACWTTAFSESLAPGPHALEVLVTNVRGNDDTATLEFEVAGPGDPGGPGGPGDRGGPGDPARPGSASEAVPLAFTGGHDGLLRVGTAALVIGAALLVLLRRRSRTGV